MPDNSQPKGEKVNVRNAADKEQQKEAKRLLKDADKQAVVDMQDLLKTGWGQRVLWRILVKCNTFSSVIGANDSLTNYNAGAQDIGHFLLDEITGANPDALLQMMKDNRKETV